MATNEEPLKENFKQEKQKEIEQNYKYFADHLDEIQQKSNEKKYVLLRHQKVISYHDNFEGAVREGQKLYKDHIYSVQKVSNSVAQLGIRRYALFHN